MKASRGDLYAIACAPIRAPTNPSEYGGVEDRHSSPSVTAIASRAPHLLKATQSAPPRTGRTRVPTQMRCRLTTMARPRNISRLEQALPYQHLAIPAPEVRKTKDQSVVTIALKQTAAARPRRPIRAVRARTRTTAGQNRKIQRSIRTSIGRTSRRHHGQCSILMEKRAGSAPNAKATPRSQYHSHGCPHRLTNGTPDITNVMGTWPSARAIIGEDAVDQSDRRRSCRR